MEVAHGDGTGHVVGPRAAIELHQVPRVVVADQRAAGVGEYGAVAWTAAVRFLLAAVLAVTVAAVQFRVAVYVQRVLGGFIFVIFYSWLVFTFASVARFVHVRVKIHFKTVAESARRNNSTKTTQNRIRGLFAMNKIRIVIVRYSCRGDSKAALISTFRCWQRNCQAHAH